MKITAAQLRRIIKEERVLYHISHKDKAKIDTYADEQIARQEYEKLNPTWGPDAGVTLTRKNPDDKIDTWTSSGIWSNEFPSVRKVPSATTEGKTMKIKLGTLRRIIRETVEQEMGSKSITPITAADYELLQKNGFGPVLGRMRGAAEDRVRNAATTDSPVTLDDLIPDFNMTMQDFMRRQPDRASQVAHITGEQVAAYLIDIATTRYNAAPGKSVSLDDDPNDPNLVYDPVTRTKKRVGLGIGGG